MTELLAQQRAGSELWDACLGVLGTLCTHDQEDPRQILEHLCQSESQGAWMPGMERGEGWACALMAILRKDWSAAKYAGMLDQCVMQLSSMPPHMLCPLVLALCRLPPLLGPSALWASPFIPETTPWERSRSPLRQARFALCGCWESSFQDGVDWDIEDCLCWLEHGMCAHGNTDHLLGAMACEAVY